MKKERMIKEYDLQEFVKNNYKNYVNVDNMNVIRIKS